ncbi:LytR/AlgR family response regulator transcription factor [Gimibacter soli]|uniref:LytTR family DNA-binding domain-containing protein n=1 Tax=Gimibacter soli TaxID=3024400 RepID=A0AAE9XX87_9PROT|nr:LytTR family DNA-binding domain-containing protein [Gimibacter soli]WCL55254.1 LytTR family DNA-binding domain-containing protein [Gimibacter soli]
MPQPHAADLWVLIVDDERHALQNLELALGSHPDWRLAAACETCDQARAALQAGPVDLVLLDIRLRRENGLKFAQEIGASDNPPLIAFVTAYDEHAVEAFDLFALDYLLKPFDDDRFAQLLQRARAMIAMKDRANQAFALSQLIADREAAERGAAPAPVGAFVVRSIGKTERVPVDDILWIKASANYVELVTAERTILHRATMASIETRLRADDFMRVHRTAIIRRSLVRTLEIMNDGTYRATLANGDSVPVSARKAEELREELKKTPD